MFSVINQEKTALRDSRGASVYRRVYLCDSAEELADLPTEDAPGSLCCAAKEGICFVLDHSRAWHPVGKGGIPWRI